MKDTPYVLMEDRPADQTKAKPSAAAGHALFQPASTAAPPGAPMGEKVENPDLSMHAPLLQPTSTWPHHSPYTRRWPHPPRVNARDEAPLSLTNCCPLL